MKKREQQAESRNRPTVPACICHKMTLPRCTILSAESHLQAEVEDKAMKRREQQAEYDRVSEIHRGRLDASAADTADDDTVRPDAEGMSSAALL